MDPKTSPAANCDDPPALATAPNSAPWVGKLHHDREEFADWGWIRDEAGALIMVVHLPFSPYGPEADEHRRNKTDPTQARVDAILAKLNKPAQP